MALFSARSQEEITFIGYKYLQGYKLLYEASDNCHCKLVVDIVSGFRGYAVYTGYRHNCNAVVCMRANKTIANIIMSIYFSIKRP